MLTAVPVTQHNFNTIPTNQITILFHQPSSLKLVGYLNACVHFLTPARPGEGVGEGDATSLRFFVDGVKTATRIAPKFGIAYGTTFVHMS